MSRAGIVFPHQLFEQNTPLSSCEVIYLVEEFLYFRQYNFHQQKIAFHRASMKFYENYLQSKKIEVVYIEANDDFADIRNLIPHLKKKGIHTLEYINTTDFWLEQRINQVCDAHKMGKVKHATSQFLNSSEEIADYFSTKKRMFQTL
jgi:deoxyribodipyrimidine photolyase-related protein